MTFSPRAIEAALNAWHSQEGPTDRQQQSAMQAALSAALAVDGVALQGWQDMESAPKNGTPVLLRLAKPLHSNDIESYVPFAEIQEVIGWWEDGWRICFMEEGTADTHGYSSNFYMGSINPLPSQPTHWQPLPPPPAASEGEEKSK